MRAIEAVSDDHGRAWIKQPSGEWHHGNSFKVVKCTGPDTEYWAWAARSSIGFMLFNTKKHRFVDAENAMNDAGNF